MGIDTIFGPFRGIGAAPDDGETAYPQLVGSTHFVGRWGDYSAGAVDENGGLWFGSEYIPSTATKPRGTYANWGTYITLSH